jgi:uncharacterized OsmC-like protein
MDPIADAMAAADAYLRAHPDEARYTDSAATATVTGGLHCRVIGPDGAEVKTDMPASVGGTARAPSAGWLLRAAEAACVATVITMRAAALNRPVGGLTVTVDSESDDRGILGLDESVPAGPLLTRVRVRGDGLEPADLRQIAEWALVHCPVTDAVRRASPLDLDVERR